jgi:heme/copper-type cytochrome/quinol oxidase subunit 2
MFRKSETGNQAMGTGKEKQYGKGGCRPPYGKIAHCMGTAAAMSTLSCQPVYAANVWTKANEIMKDVYNQIVLISTVAAIVAASAALLMMNFSRSGKTVDESRAWLKRICITWAILNGLGFIMAYITPFFAGGKWGG